MARVIKRDVIKRGNVTTVYRNIGNTPDRSIKDLKQKPVKKPSNRKTIGHIGY